MGHGFTTLHLWRQSTNSLLPYAPDNHQTFLAWLKAQRPHLNNGFTQYDVGRWQVLHHYEGILSVKVIQRWHMLRA